MAKKQQNNGDDFNFDPKKAKASLEYMIKMAESGHDFSQSMSRSNGFIGSIASQLLGMSNSDFYTKIEHSSDVMAKMREDLNAYPEAIEAATEAVNKGFSNALNSARGKGVKVNESISLMTNQLSKKMPEIAKQIQDAFDSKNLAGLSPEAMKQFKKIVKDKEGFEKLNKFFESDTVKNLKKIESEMDQLNNKFQSQGKYVLDVGKALEKYIEKISKHFELSQIKASLISFDKILTKSQMDSGIMFKENSLAMAELTSTTQQFGMGIAETTELMSGLGGVLRTTDFDLLSKAAADMAAVGKATGLSATEVSELGGQMMLMGKTSKEVSEFAESTMKSAQNFGVNGRKVMQDIVKNIPKFRQMGFQGGEESLKRMALQAEHLGQNIDEIFDMSKKARNIEGALDMASQLQLAGGSFSNINPMDLLSAARKGPQELQKILGQMGSDIGKFDKVTGKMAFDAVDYDRLQMVADATGMSVDSLQKQITTMNQDAQKTELIPPGLFDSLDDEQKAFLLNNIGKDGKLSMSLDGVDDLANLQKGNIDSAMKQAEIEKGTLEEQAKQNTSFEESIENLKNSIMNVFVVFEPVIKALTNFIQWLNAAFANFGIIGKTLFAVGIAGLALLFSSGKQFLSGLAFGKGQKAGLEGGGIGSFFGKGKKQNIPAAGGGISTPDTGVKGGGGGGGLKGFATAIKEMSKEGAGIDMKGILKLSGAIFLLVAPIGILAAVFSKVDPVLLLAFGGVMVEMSLALLLMSKMTGQISIPNVLKGALAMVIMGAALIPFSFAMQMMAGIPWTQMLISIGMAALAVLALTGIGALMMSPAGVAFLFGAAALALAGLSLMVFGASLLVAAAGFNAMATVNWSGFSGMGDALMSILPGLLGLAGVGLFAIPGLIMMSFALGGLAAVMVVLAPAMQMAAISTNSMADGITKLKEAVKGLDVDKLNSMANAAERLSTASAISGLANAVTGLFGGGGGKEEKQQRVTIEPITINLDMDGATIRKFTVKQQDAQSLLS